MSTIESLSSVRNSLQLSLDRSATWACAAGMPARRTEATAKVRSGFIVEILGFYRQPNGIWPHPKRQRHNPAPMEPDCNHPCGHHLIAEFSGDLGRIKGRWRCCKMAGRLPR